MAVLSSPTQYTPSSAATVMNETEGNQTWVWSSFKVQRDNDQNNKGVRKRPRKGDIIFGG